MVQYKCDIVRTNSKGIHHLFSEDISGECPTVSPQVPYIQGYNNVNFTLSNVLVTEVWLAQSYIVFMMSVHTTLLCKDRYKIRNNKLNIQLSTKRLKVSFNNTVPSSR